MSQRPWILGISASHNGSVCLLHGDELVVAIQQERLTRVKRDRVSARHVSVPVRYCLEHAGISVKDLSAISVCSQKALRHDNVRRNPFFKDASHVPVYQLPHHAAHAYSAFAVSGFEDALVLVVDGLGSPFEDFGPTEGHAVLGDTTNTCGETVSLYRAEGTKVDILEKHVVPDGKYLGSEGVGLPTFGSLGGMFNAAAWSIFREVAEAGKVMGLAPYGKVTLPPDAFFAIRDDGSFAFNEMTARNYPLREPWPKDAEHHQNLAASVQGALETALLHIVRRLRDRVPDVRRLCYAGGVALNSVANERIMREAGFGDVFILPAAEDSGPSIGAAYHALWQLTGNNTKRRLVHDAVGRSYSAAEVDTAIASCPAISVERSGDPVSRAVELLVAGKIIGWFQGRSELGPRALGQRSILCDPRLADGKRILNERVKHREGFRPFAPVIPLEAAHEWFAFDKGVPADSPSMLRVADFRPEKRAEVPAVVHVDGTGRLQTVTAEANGPFYRLVKEFGARTGVPIILNTSFNVMGEPIVETPEDALWALLYTGLDACVLGDVIVTKAEGFRSVLDLVPRLVCRGFRCQFDLDGSGRGLAGRFSSVWAMVDTPWGEATNPCPETSTDEPMIKLLNAMDGQRNGHAIAEELSLDPADVIRRIGVLRRMRIIECAASKA